MSNLAIEIKDIGKKYALGERESYLALRDFLSNPFKKKDHEKPFWALKNVNFSIQKGEVVGLIGKNGSGKSTLLKILSRITEPTEGKIKMRGRVSSLLEVGTGFHPELTGRENIFLNGAILGMRKKEIKRNLDEIVEFSGVNQFLDTPVKRYSSGMYVRLAFAVAANLESEIMLVDEVLAVGDAEFQEKCMGKMGDLAKSGRTVIFVSHNMGSISKLCNTAIWLESGKVKFNGDVQDAVDHYLSSSEEIIGKKIIDLKNRDGKGEVKLVDVYWTNDKGKRINKIRVGQRVHFHFLYKSKKKILINPEFGILFGDSVGRYLTRLHSFHSEKKYKSLPGTGNVTCTVDKFPLMTGKYNLGLSIMVAGEIQDLIDLPHALEVSHDVYYKDGMHDLNPKYQGFFIDQYWSEQK